MQLLLGVPKCRKSREIPAHELSQPLGNWQWGMLRFGCFFSNKAQPFDSALVAADGGKSSESRLKYPLNRLSCFPMKRAVVKTSPLRFLAGTSVLAAEMSSVCSCAVPVGDNHVVPCSCIAVAISAIFADLAKTWAALCFN